MVDLTQINKVSDDDKLHKLDQWARMFKATTWEELKMLAEQNPVIDQAVNNIFKLSEDERIRYQMEAREEYYRNERTHQVLLERSKAETREALTKAEEALSRAEKAEANIQVLESTIVDKDSQLADKDSRIAELEAILTAAGITYGETKTSET